MTKFESGFVYVLTNRAMPGLVKVGRTTALVDDRAKDLYGTSVPFPFDVHLRLATSQPSVVEREAHRLLAACRSSPRREFFDASPTLAIEAVQQAALAVDGIEPWTRRAKVCLVRPGDRITLRLRARQFFVWTARPQLLAKAEPLDIWQVHADYDVLHIFGTNDSRLVAGISDNDSGAALDAVPFLDRTGAVPNAWINGRERLVPGDRLVWLGLAGDSKTCIWNVFESCDYCQVLSRTEQLRFAPDGAPLLMNYVTAELPEMMWEPIRAALALPVARNWAPRRAADRSGFAPIASQVAPPEYWMESLGAPARGRRKQASSS